MAKNNKKGNSNDNSIPLDFESFAAQRGGYPAWGDSGAHKAHSRLSKKQWNRIIANLIKKDEELQLLRDNLREEYDHLVSEGIVRPLTRRERLFSIASGHSDNESVKAARRILFRHYGISLDFWEDK